MIVVAKTALLYKTLQTFKSLHLLRRENEKWPQLLFVSRKGYSNKKVTLLRIIYFFKYIFFGIPAAICVLLIFVFSVLFLSSK